MTNDYFSDRELGPRPRTGEEMTADAWARWGANTALLRHYGGASGLGANLRVTRISARPLRGGDPRGRYPAT